MRNIEVVIALLFGYFIAFLTRHDGAKYVTTANFDVAPVVTFLWKKWFGIGFYTPALLREPLALAPSLRSCLVTTASVAYFTEIHPLATLSETPHALDADCILSLCAALLLVQTFNGIMPFPYFEYSMAYHSFRFRLCPKA